MKTWTVSLPDELKERMECKLGVNWSRVAVKAFDREIRALTLDRNGMMTTGVERLRASREKSLERDFAEGIELGQTWALGEADWDELEAATALGPEATFAEVAAALSAIERDADVVKEKLGGVTSDAMVRGFLKGAALVKEEVVAAPHPSMDKTLTGVPLATPDYGPPPQMFGRANLG